jgi:iron(III) transport system substrate-binding protein
MTIDRRQFLATSAAGAGALLLPSALRAQAQAELPDYYPADYGQIIEASKAENQLLVYSNMSVDMWAGVVERYNQLYPWITVQRLDLGSTEVFERYLAERGTGSQTCDAIVTVSPEGFIEFQQRGEIMEYESPELPHVQDWSVPYPGLYTIAIDPLLFAWNKALLPEDLVPTSFEELYENVKKNPDIFRNKLTTYTMHLGNFYAAYYGFVQRHGDKAWEWFDAVGPMTRVERSSGPMLEKILSGEYIFGYFVGSGNTWLSMEDANRARLLGWSFMGDGTPVTMRGAVIPQASTNVNAAKLWMDVMLSHAGQVGFAKGGRTPFRPDVTREDVGGAYTFSAIRDEIGSGDDGIILADYNPELIPNWDSFVARWKQAMNL